MIDPGLEEREHLERAMAAMEAQRGVLGDAVVEAAIAAFREKLARLSSGADAPAAAAPLPLGGEEPAREISALCAEVLAFASPAGSPEPEQLRGEIDGLWKRLEAAAARRGGRMVGVKAGSQRTFVFESQLNPNAPESAPGSAPAEPAADALVRPQVLAVHAALDMLAETRRFASVQILKGLHFSAGVNSGMVAGRPAAGASSLLRSLDEKRLLAGVVQLAGQIQAAAGQDEVLVSQSVQRAVRGAFDLQALEPLQSQDAPGPVALYRVRGVRTRLLQPVSGLTGPLGLAGAAGHPVGSTEMVGREADLDQLQAALEGSLRSSSLRAVTVVGEAGIGKSRLVREFLYQVDRGGQPFVLFRARGNPQMNRFPYALLRDLLSFRFKIHEGDLPAAARDKLLRGVEEWLGPDSVETAHWIGHLAGCDFPHSPYLNGRLDDPRQARKLAFQAINHFLAAIAKQNPLLILVDDLQWADDGSLDWLESLAASTPGGPLLLVNMIRPALLERRPNWMEGAAAHLYLHLGPLADESIAGLSGQLLRASLVSGRLPAWMDARLDEIVREPVQYIVERAGGSPLYAEELAQVMLDTGVFSFDIGPRGEMDWLIDRSLLAPDLLPGSLEEVLQARLDSLPAAELEVLLRAAVVGPVFWESAVRTLFEVGPGGAETDLLRSIDLAEVLHGLQRRGLIFRRAVSAFEHTEEYVFKNALLYEVAYEDMLVRRRRQDHARVAIWLATQSGERVETYAATIAGHYERAEEHLLAADWYGMAALQARRSSAPEAAVRYFARALELLPDEPAYFAQRVQLYKGMWDVQWWQARYADALATGQALLAVAEAKNDLPAQAAAWNRLAAIQNRLADYPAALRSVQRAERLARAGGAEREVVLALFNRGVTLFRMGNSAAALEAGEEALAVNQALAEGSEPAASSTAAGISSTQAAAGSSAPEVSEPPASDTAAPAISPERPPITDLDAARLIARQNLVTSASDPAAVDESPSTGPFRQMPASHAAPTRPTGGYRPGDPLRTSAERETVRILNLLAMINQRAGRYEPAEDDYRQVLAICRQRGDRPGMVSALNNLGVNAHLRGDHRAAAQYYQEALALTRELGYHDLELVCLDNLAGAQVELGEYRQAEAGLREVLLRVDGGSWFLLTEVYRYLALACLGQKRSEEAALAAEHALALALENHMAEHVGRAWRVLGRIAAARRSPVMVNGRPRGAHDCYAASLQVFVEISAAGEQARTAREWAGYELEHGDHQEGLRLWQEARDLFIRLGLTIEAEHMDQLAAARGMDD